MYSMEEGGHDFFFCSDYDWFQFLCTDDEIFTSMTFSPTKFYLLFSKSLRLLPLPLNCLYMRYVTRSKPYLPKTMLEKHTTSLFPNIKQPPYLRISKERKKTKRL